MNLIEAIQTRHSVRRYKDKTIEANKLAIIRKTIEEANAESGLNMQLVVNEPKGFNGLFISTYGQFSGVKNYIVMAAPKGKQWEEKVGYYGEKLVILAQTLGLNTCWAGLTYKKIPGTFTLRDGDIVHCMISLGYGENQGKPHPQKKSASEFFEPYGPKPAWFMSGIAAAMLAPTAVNQQKFKFILQEGNKVSAKTFFSPWGYTVIDLGIVKYHFEIGADKENFEWV
jgi:nitroreductase